MKLMELRGLIRKPGNPTMVVDLGNGVPMSIAFQKTPLLEELGKAFNDERTAETGLSYDPVTNLLSVDGFVGQVDDDDTDSLYAPAADTKAHEDEPMDPAEITALDADDEDDLL